MFFSIDPANGVAIYEQIVRQIKFAVARDAVKVGELIPSVRELARELAVNPNTVARAYRQLQSDGVLITVRGEGLEVASDARGLCRRETTEIIRLRLRQVLSEARQSQLTATEISKLFEAELKSIEKQES
jgi:GntR family transcriptional regulator